MLKMNRKKVALGVLFAILVTSLFFNAAKGYQILVSRWVQAGVGLALNQIIDEASNNGSVKLTFVDKDKKSQTVTLYKKANAK